jgi:hypothetical protein
VRTVTVEHTVTVTATPAPVPASAPTPSSVDGSTATGIGKAFSERGITATVTSAKLTHTIAFDGGTKSAGAGAEFAVITTKITNHSKTGLDLTCGYPVADKLINDAEQQYDAIQDLYKVDGNPECNAQVGPGFSDKMTYIYRVPSGSHIVGWGFSDLTDMAYATDDPTIVPLDLH